MKSKGSSLIRRGKKVNMSKKMSMNIYLSTIILKSKMNKQNKNSLIDTENILTVARWEEGGEVNEKT